MLSPKAWQRDQHCCDPAGNLYNSLPDDSYELMNSSRCSENNVVRTLMLLSGTTKHEN
jgi:hypothetical protein